MKRIITIRDIASALNTTPSTVSRALNDHPRISIDMKSRIQNKALEMGYQLNTLASNLRKGAGKSIGVMVPRINRNFFASVIEGIEKLANEAGYKVIICQTNESYEKEIDNLLMLQKARVDGVLMSLSAETKNFNHISDFQKMGIPLVFFDRKSSDLGVSSVSVDNFESSKAIVNHMLTNGYKKIVHFSGPQHIEMYRDRYHGYLQAHKDHNQPVDDSFLYSDVLTRDKGYQITGQMLENKIQFDAIFAASDFSAVGAIIKMRELNIKVPSEIGVAGFANEMFTWLMEPPLTTVDLNGHLIGEEAVRMLLERIESTEKIEVQHKIVPTQIHFRKSTLKL